MFTTQTNIDRVVTRDDALLCITKPERSFRAVGREIFQTKNPKGPPPNNKNVFTKPKSYEIESKLSVYGFSRVEKDVLILFFYFFSVFIVTIVKNRTGNASESRRPQESTGYSIVK